MPFSGLDQQKAYYYVICVIAFFILMWGVIDLSSVVMGITANRGPSEVSMQAPLQIGEEAPIPQEMAPEADFEHYYQDKVLYDRLFDSLARILISGVVFFYCRHKAHLLEKKA